jgi:hypothetical protein
MLAPYFLPFFVAALLVAVHENRGTTFDSWAKNPQLSPFWPMKKSQCERRWCLEKVVLNAQKGSFIVS